MKKIISVLALVLAMTMIMSVSAFAAPVFNATGGLPTGITAIDADADSIDVTATATSGAYYGILLVEGDDLPTVDDAIFYIDQKTAEADTVAFNALPIIPEVGTELTLYISSNVAGAELIAIPLVYDEATANDYITSTDTSKGTIAADVKKNGVAAALNHKTMGDANGKYVISLKLDTTAYPAAGNAEAGYIVKAVNADGTDITGATVFYSKERAMYVALIPSTVADYKFEVIANGTEGATTNEVIKMYGDMNENETIKNQTADFANFKKAYLGNLTDAKKVLIADVSGDGQVATADFANFKKAYLGGTYTFAVLNVNK